MPFIDAAISSSRNTIQTKKSFNACEKPFVRQTSYSSILKFENIMLNKANYTFENIGQRSSTVMMSSTSGVGGGDHAKK